MAHYSRNLVWLSAVWMFDPALRDPLAYYTSRNNLHSRH